MKRKPSTPENSRHRDRPHKFAIVTMEVEKGGTEWNGRIGGERGATEGGRLGTWMLGMESRHTSSNGREKGSLSGEHPRKLARYSED